jgi:hypothetical protein
MHVAGGLYREICLHPAWNGLFGSGGRAAQALATLGNTTTLHSYFEDPGSTSLDPYHDRGVRLELSPRQSAIAFAYLHPLSTPHFEPRDVTRCPAIHVGGDTVLRFGFVEGDAVVRAKRAVFDPQGWRNQLAFHENGSSADELAIVLNEAELCNQTGIARVSEAAISLVRAERASVVVVKRGVRGATVVDSSLAVHDVPAFRSERVFKIGTGDIFSALFAHFWGQCGDSAVIAAQQASLGVAHHADTQDFPHERLACDRDAVGGIARGPVAIWGASDTLGRRYALEEAVFRLGELGIDAFPHRSTFIDQRFAALLILAEGLPNELASAIGDIEASGIPIVFLDEIGSAEIPSTGSVSDTTDDFTTALYRVAWAASSLKTS